MITPLNRVERLRALMDAMGWNQELAAHKFGFADGCTISRILRGERPQRLVDFLITLEKLEGAYADEIEAFRKGLRESLPGTRGRTKRQGIIDWRIKNTPKMGRMGSDGPHPGSAA